MMQVAYPRFISCILLVLNIDLNEENLNGLILSTSVCGYEYIGLQISHHFFLSPHNIDQRILSGDESIQPPDMESIIIAVLLRAIDAISVSKHMFVIYVINNTEITLL